MFEIRQFSTTNVAFAALYSESKLFKQSEKMFEFLQVLRKCIGPDENVVDVDQAIHLIHV